MRHWHVLTVAPQRERWVGYELHRSLGLEWYVPLERQANVLRGRLMERVRPLMPGYTFVSAIEPTVWRDVAETRHVTGWLEMDDDPAVILDWEVKRIRQMEAEHNTAITDSRKRIEWQAGDTAVITSGHFTNVIALLEAVRGSRARFRVPAGSVWVSTDNLAPVA